LIPPDTAVTDLMDYLTDILRSFSHKLSMETSKGIISSIFSPNQSTAPRSTLDYSRHTSNKPIDATAISGNTDISSYDSLILSPDNDISNESSSSIHHDRDHIYVAANDYLSNQSSDGSRNHSDNNQPIKQSANISKGRQVNKSSSQLDREDSMDRSTATRQGTDASSHQKLQKLIQEQNSRSNSSKLDFNNQTQSQGQHLYETGSRGRGDNNTSSSKEYGNSTAKEMQNRLYRAQLALNAMKSSSS